MSLLRNDLFSFLKADAGISALVVQRVYPIVLPQKVTYPAAYYSMVSDVRARNLLGPAGKARARVTVNSCATSYASAHELADAVRAALDGFAGMMGSTKVGSVNLDNELDLFEQEANTVGIYRVAQDYIIAHLEGLQWQK